MAEICQNRTVRKDLFFENLLLLKSKNAELTKLYGQNISAQNNVLSGNTIFSRGSTESVFRTAISQILLPFN